MRINRQALLCVQAVALVNIAALGRTVQQLVSLLVSCCSLGKHLSVCWTRTCQMTGYLCLHFQDEAGNPPPSATPRPPSRHDLPSTGVAAQQLTDCLASLFAASVQLRHLAQLNKATALELRTHPTCQELVSW